MRRIFVDALYWIAIISRHDQWHQAALKISQTLSGCHFVTTEEVLTEFLNSFSEAGPFTRQRASAYVRKLYHNPSITVLPQSNAGFLAGLTLYETRPDKGYSLTDCISMVTMRQQGITEVLTHDAHFAQEGFVTLL